MDVLVTGRHCHISETFREHVQERIAKIEKLRDRVIRVEVQVTAETNNSEPDKATTVELTLFSKGPVVRSEGAAEDKTVAFEQALDRMRTQLRRAADRRKTHRGHHAPESLRYSTALPELPIHARPQTEEEKNSDVHLVAGIEVQGDGPLIVREKTHAASPMTLDQALDQMELVGHDFFLYIDAETNLASVVYRRRGYDYGVIRLDPSAEPEEAKSA